MNSGMYFEGSQWLCFNCLWYSTSFLISKVGNLVYAHNQICELDEGGDFDLCFFQEIQRTLLVNFLMFFSLLWELEHFLQVSRSIGDAYLKNSEFNREPLLPKFRLPEPFDKPILKAEPCILVHKLYPEDRFLIFASDGLWEHLGNQEAVDMVHNCPRNVGLSICIVQFLLLFWWLCSKKNRYGNGHGYRCLQGAR